MKTLKGKIALVGGSSRGAGRGIALALGEAGAIIYVAARTSRDGPKPADGMPGTIEETAEAVTARGGHGIPIRADLGDEAQAAAVFERIEKEHGRLDVMANSVWSADFMTEGYKKFWELSSQIFNDTLTTIGACWWTSVYAARLMVKQQCGLIIHVTDNLHHNPSAYREQTMHDLGHEALNRLIWGMSAETKSAQIAVVGLNPGFMRTERVKLSMTSDAIKKQFRYDLSETPEYIGRAVVALAADSNVMRKNGQLLWGAELAEEYGFTDVDGRRIPVFDPKAPQQDFPD